MVKLYRSTKERRKAKLKHKIRGTAGVPRLSVFRSNKNIYIQAIDDKAQKTLAALSSIVYKKKGAKTKRSKTDTAHLMGKDFGKILKKNKISKAVFGRGPYKYHGRVKAIAEGIRESGIKF